MTGSCTNTRVLTDVAVTSPIRRITEIFFSYVHPITALPCSQIIMEDRYAK